MLPKNTLPAALLALFLLPPCVAAQTATALPTPDREALRKQDARLEVNRYAAPLALDDTPSREAYTYAGGEWHWRHTYTLASADGLALFLDSLHLPPGSRITLENAHGTTGPFTQADASDRGRLFTGFLPGERVTLHYAGPRPDAPPFHVWRADHVYRPDRWTGTRNKDFGDSNTCHTNANCSDGDGWEDEKSGTGRINIIVAQGTGYCTGNLINNTAEDGRPYLLTGFHCMDGFTPLYDLWSVDFDYLGADCNDPATAPVPTTYRNVEFRAGRRETDALLLEIIDVDFASEDHYFAGWDRRDQNFFEPIIHFHHPRGDVMKLGLSNSVGARILPLFIDWNNGVRTPASHHFRINSAVGTFEVGSSGSAYFNQDHRIIGQLNGGNAVCPGTSEAYVGRFALSWDGGPADTANLQTFLDPLGTNPLTLDGATLPTKRYVSGTVTYGGVPAAGATITFAWPGGSRDYVTDAQGVYRGERPALEEAFTIAGDFGANDLDARGVDVGDIITIRREILGFEDMLPAQRVAADVNGSGTIRVSDIISITRVILGLQDWGTRPNWVVIPAGFPLDPLPPNPAAPIGISLQNAGVYELPVDFIAVKTGDAAGNVD